MEFLMKRLEMEIADMEKSPPEGCKLGPVSSNNKQHWLATFKGPPNSPYDGGTFKVDIVFPPDYPFKPPRVKFLTKMYHPNISMDDGQICISTLKSDWSPALKIDQVLLSIISLLTNPNPDDPLSPDAANLYKSSIDKYNEKVKQFTKSYANETGTSQSTKTEDNNICSNCGDIRNDDDTCDCIHYDCNNCNDTGCGDCTEYDCYNCNDKGCRDCNEDLISDCD